jgi:hypothetical protein
MVPQIFTKLKSGYSFSISFLCAVEDNHALYITSAALELSIPY